MADNIETLADPLAADLADPSKYKRETAAVFRPHKRYFRNEDGTWSDKVKYEVKEEDLAEIARLSNAAVEESAHYPRQTIGHVVPGATDEKSQTAQLIGVTKNYRVAKLPSGKKVVAADLYTRIDKVDEASGFPYRSAEYNWKNRQIRGVARLLQDPALELGTTAYADGETVEYADAVPAYKAKDKSNGDDKSGGAGKPDSGKNGANPDGKPGEKPDDKGGYGPNGEKPRYDRPDKGSVPSPTLGNLNPDEVVAADRLIEYIKSNYEGAAQIFASKVGVLPDQKPAPPDNGAADEADMAESEEGEEGGEDGAPKFGGAPGKDKGKNGGSQNSSGRKPGKNEDDEMSANAEADLRKELNQLKVRLILDQLENVEHYQFDREEAELAMVAMTDEQRAKKADSIRKYSKKKSPVAAPIEVLQHDVEGVDAGTMPISVSPDKLSFEEYQAAHAHIRSNPRKDIDADTAWGLAVDYVKSKRKAK